jgi:hypothetical protein
LTAGLEPLLDTRIVIAVDGEVVVERSFAVGGQHNYLAYRIPLATGDHQVAVLADTGALHERSVTTTEDRCT